MMLVMERMETDLFRAISSDETGKGDSVLYNFRSTLANPLTKYPSKLQQGCHGSAHRYL